METQQIKKPVQVKETNPDFEVRSLDAMCMNESKIQHQWWHNLKYLAVGLWFGIILVKSEVVSWFRIQEMFRLQSFHMYGTIGAAIGIGIISVWLIKKFKVKTIYGESIELHPRQFNKGQVYGGLLFGAGWALTGACPGPLYALLGTGSTIMLVVIGSAVIGTWVYGRFRNNLPH